MVKRIIAALLALMTVCTTAYADSENFSFIYEYNGEFSADVSEDDWFYAPVADMYRLGLASGYDGMYMPDKQLTIAEAMTIASRLRSIYYTGSTYEADNYTSGGEWYDKYMKYAEDNGIIDDRFHGMENTPALRKYAAYIFSSVFEMDGINSVAPESIPDIDHEYSYYITDVYNKGIMTGVDADMRFEPDGTLKRCEAASLAVRCALPYTRVKTDARAPQFEPQGAITVICDGGTGGVLTLSKETSPGVWEEILNTPCRIGKNGAYKTGEGDGKTPCGTFRLGRAFGICEDPGTELEYTQLNENHYWIDDPDSAYYNQLVDIGFVYPDWNSAEHLVYESPAYDYAVDTGFNAECVPGLGSAIFIHCSTGSATNGCIAISEEDMIMLLRNAPVNTTVTITCE